MSALSDTIPIPSPSIQHNSTDWLRVAFRIAFNATTSTIYDEDISIEQEQDLGRDARFSETIRHVRWQRKFVHTYNAVLFVIILVIAAVHWGGRVGQAWKRRSLKVETRGDEAEVVKDDNIVISGARDERLEGVESGESSESSSTIIVSETERAKDNEDESKPLLPARRKQKQRHPLWALLWRRLRACLTYQPRPIPLINKTLPSNGTTIFILSFLGFNLFYTFYNLPMSKFLIFVAADRFGLMFAVQLPLLYLLAAKNQPIKRLTGYSYEALNILHRRLGEYMCLLALLHFAGMFAVWYILLAPQFTLTWFLTTKLALFGIGAFLSYELLYLTSLGSFRQRAYELFLALHIVLQTGALIFLYLHFWTARPYVLASLAIFLTDRLVFRLLLKTSQLQASLTVLEDEQTVLLSADWDIQTSSSGWRRCINADIKQGWKPAEHVFICVPSLSIIHIMQAHPFTIASAAPTLAHQDDHQHMHSMHAWLSLIIRAQDGFTSDLLAYAQRHDNVAVRIDGPYGSSHALHMLEDSDVAIFVAGGSGIAVVFPLIWAFLHERRDLESSAQQTKKQFCLVWVMHSRKHLSWLPEERLDELRVLGLKVVIPGPTEEVGRPDLSGIMGDALEDVNVEKRVGTVVSGPDGLNRGVRNICAGMAWRGRDVRVQVEKFGW